MVCATRRSSESYRLVWAVTVVRPRCTGAATARTVPLLTGRNMWLVEVIVAVVLPSGSPARYTQQVMAAQARAGEPPGPEVALNKLALSANMKRLAEFVAAVLGPALVADTGAWGTYAWTSVVLGAPGYRLGGGTDEVLKNAIAQRVLGLPRPA